MVLLADILTIFARAPRRPAAPHYAYIVTLVTYNDINEEVGYTTNDVSSVNDDGAANISFPSPSPRWRGQSTGPSASSAG
jgi:hypothetical protein